MAASLQGFHLFIYAWLLFPGHWRYKHEKENAYSQAHQIMEGERITYSKRDRNMASMQ